MKHNNLMRSLLFVPAHNKKFLDKASNSEADVILLDLEDSCLPNTNKQIGRDLIKEYVRNNMFRNKLVFPRVNERLSGELLKDIHQLTFKGIDGFMYPKADSGEDIYFIDKLLETIECEKNIPIGTFKLIPLIETTGAILQIKEICNNHRVVAVAFGHLDYVLSLQGRHDDNKDSIFVARSMVAIGARSCDVIPIDTIHPHKLHDTDDLEKHLNKGKDLGFEGMLLLNPLEIPFAHKYYSPSQEEVEWAENIVRLSKDAINCGQGVAIKEGVYIGPPIVKSAEKILSKHRQIIQKKENSNHG